jgi:hypothetical protein
MTSAGAYEREGLRVASCSHRLAGESRTRLPRVDRTELAGVTVFYSTNRRTRVVKKKTRRSKKNLSFAEFAKIALPKVQRVHMEPGHRFAHIYGMFSAANLRDLASMLVKIKRQKMSNGDPRKKLAKFKAKAQRDLFSDTKRAKAKAA